ncbi:MAG TPA: MFS transporter, partial [Candidatus Limnocylindrales bacterium]|nr:MFS transporter [Candidatus Limnocylindrales bacterium]
MAGQPAKGEPSIAETSASWLPLIIVMMVQIQISFNAFNVSINGITTDLGIAATSVGLALTTGTFAMASFILLGAKLGAKIGVRRAFQIGVIIPAIAAGVIAVSQNGTQLFVAQALSGASVALAAPALTVMIAANYKGKQQGQAIGFLASAIPLAQVISLLIAGTFATTIGWRWSFALVAAIGAVNFLLSWKLKPIPAQKDLVIDGRGALLSSVAVLLISFAFTGLNAWGIFWATPNAPFSILGLSPVPFLFLFAILFVQAFFAWTRRRMDEGKPPIFSLKVLDTPQERAVVYSMSIMLFVGTAASFLLPLYMQTVQGLNGIQTSLSIIPYTLSIFVANTLVARLYNRFSPSQIARTAFIVVAAALTLLAFTIRNDWGQLVIIVGLVSLGLAQGCIVALVFNTLLSSSPKELAGDVGAWRGLTHNVSGSAGIAVATTLAVALLANFSYTQTRAYP